MSESSPLVEHLLELRSRLLKCVAAVLLIFLCLAPFANELYTWVAAPLQKYLADNGSSMISIDLVEPFFIPFKLAFFMAFLAAIPVLLYQIWAFLAPGLYQHERRLIGPLLASTVLLFYAGVAFAYFVLFPIAFKFFTTFAPEGVTVATDIGHYYGFVFKIFIAFGVAFEIPIATILLIRSGTVSADSLAEKRPYVIIACFVIGMILTPPDVFSQTILAVPVWMLFECGVFFGRFITPKTDTAEE